MPTIPLLTGILQNLKNGHNPWTKQVKLPRLLSNQMYKDVLITFISALFIIVKEQKLTKCPAERDWLNKFQNIHTMEFLVRH